jgi:hypothetical protein
VSSSYLSSSYFSATGLEDDEQEQEQGWGLGMFMFWGGDDDSGDGCCCCYEGIECCDCGEGIVEEVIVGVISLGGWVSLDF